MKPDDISWFTDSAGIDVDRKVLVDLIARFRSLSVEMQDFLGGVAAIWLGMSAPRGGVVWNDSFDSHFALTREQVAQHLSVAQEAGIVWVSFDVLRNPTVIFESETTILAMARYQAKHDEAFNLLVHDLDFCLAGLLTQRAKMRTESSPRA